jgi:hypothetical protein
MKISMNDSRIDSISQLREFVKAQLNDGANTSDVLQTLLDSGAIVFSVGSDYPTDITTPEGNARTDTLAWEKIFNQLPSYDQQAVDTFLDEVIEAHVSQGEMPSLARILEEYSVGKHRVIDPKDGITSKGDYEKEALNAINEGDTATFFRIHNQIEEINQWYYLGGNGTMYDIDGNLVNVGNQ